MLQCPVCALPLARENNKLACDSQHHFDRARQGYFNLLLNQHKKSKAPGDNAAMVLARSQFLNKGYYQSISDTLNQFAIDHLWQQQDAKVVDLGCGEGYYTSRLQHALEDHQIMASVNGLDISKEAVKAAAKRNQQVDWFVANAKKPPFMPNSAHLVLNIFNRIMPDSLARLCHQNGRLVIASAGSHHLQQLKEAIYDAPRFKAFDCKEALAPYFNHQHRTTLDYVVNLDQEGVTSLLGMTPHVWRSSPETQKTLNALNQLELKVQVNLDIFAPK